MTKLQADFIKMIGDAAVSYYKDFRILPSLTIAQAILESNWEGAVFQGTAITSLE